MYILPIKYVLFQDSTSTNTFPLINIDFVAGIPSIVIPPAPRSVLKLDQKPPHINLKARLLPSRMTRRHAYHLLPPSQPPGSGLKLN